LAITFVSILLKVKLGGVLGLSTRNYQAL